MNRLPHELDRLFGLGRSAVEGMVAHGAAASGRGPRLAVLALALPAGWAELSSVWRGVQTDLGLPAPAIAVDGVDALQLWFSFASPVAPAAGARFLEGLRERFLDPVDASRVRMFSGAAELPVAPCVPTGPERWSAFVTHDLASVFADTPWLDLPPNDEGQAAILRALQPITPEALDTALAALGGRDDALVREPVARAASGPSDAGREDAAPGGPARFLTGVMNDATAPLALRIEAARILLACARG